MNNKIIYAFPLSCRRIDAIRASIDLVGVQLVLCCDEIARFKRRDFQTCDGQKRKHLVTVLPGPLHGTSIVECQAHSYLRGIKIWVVSFSF